MNHKQPVRSSFDGRKLVPAHGRSSRPQILHKRGHSYNHTQTHGHNTGSSAKPSAGQSKNAGTEVVYQNDDCEDGMAGFLQFCATCEKQIVTPGSSILYCSESCRRKDARTTTPPHIVQSPSVTASTTSYFDAVPVDIVPQRSPTVFRPAPLGFSDNASPDSSSPNQEVEERQTSEAARYLALFYSSTDAQDTNPIRRPRTDRASTGTDSGLPSLTNTPVSSVGTAISVSAYRPLPIRQDSHFPNGSAILVMASHQTAAPSSSTQLMNDMSQKSSASTLTSLQVAEAEDVSFSRRTPTWRHSNVNSGSLKQLFSRHSTGPPSGSN